MRILLDTCALIWLCSAPEKLSVAARRVLQRNADVDLFVSDASVLEIALKSAIGKLKLPTEPRLWIEEQLGVWDIKSLPITHEVIFESANLIRHHNDPFDRLIIATSMINNLPVLTSDRFFESYGCEVVW